MEIDYNKFDYSVPLSWYKDVYVDIKEPCDAGRSFSLLNREKSKECFLLICGYRGYPGELVRPAYDLFLEGYDVFVPRLPGMGTSCKDFISSNGNDWLKLVDNALNDLKNKYEKINVLGHSMGAALVAIKCSDKEFVNKIVYASPSFENLEMPFFIRIYLRILSIFTSKVKTKWNRSNTHLHYYEGAPKDENYLGDEYYQWYFTSRLLDYYKISRKALKYIKKYKHDNLLVCPLCDKKISIPSCKEYIRNIGDKANVIYIDNGTHLIFYDIDKVAEQKAIEAIIEYALK